MKIAVSLLSVLVSVNVALAELRTLGLFLEVEGVLVDEASLQTALYEPAPSECEDTSGNNNGNGIGIGNGCNRYLEEAEQDLSFLDEHENRELLSFSCSRSPRICCSLCAGFKDGSSCYLYTAYIADCRYYMPSCCGRRRLGEQKPLVQVRDAPTERAEECLELEGQEAHRLEYARLLMKDWPPTSRAKFQCREIIMDELCNMKWNQFKDAAGGQYWDDETTESEMDFFDNLQDTCASMKQEEKDRQKALKDAEKAAKDAAKGASKPATKGGK